MPNPTPLARLRAALLLAPLSGCPQVAGGSSSDAATVDRPPPPRDPCVGALDASRDGRRFGATTLVRFDRTSLAPAAAALFAGCGLPTTAPSALAVRYTLRADATLAVRAAQSADPAAAPVARLVVLGACGAAPTRLACGGDLAGVGPLGVFPAVTASRLRAGSEVVIALALGEGHGEVEITEVTEVRAVGDACDAQQRADVCAAGSSCRAVEGVAWRCVRDGSPLARCRSAGDPCDPGLRCVGASPSLPGYCAPLAEPGEPCTPGACRVGRCLGPYVVGRTYCGLAGAGGDVCLRSADCEAGQVCNGTACQAAIAEGDRCRLVVDATGNTSVEAPCADGALCAAGRDGVARCANAAGPGARCALGHSGCAAPLECRVDAAADAGVCSPRGDGSRGSPCASNTCAAGLACRDGVCTTALAAGAPCAYSDGFGCGAAASCAAAVRGDPMGRCVPDGADGGRCRWVAPLCDAGLSCSFEGTCRRGAPPGAACGAEVCAGGVACLPLDCAEGARCEATCRREGADGGWCRAASPPCDEGLSCVSARPDGPTVCRRRLAPGAGCDLRWGDACPVDQACMYGPGATSPRCLPAPTSVRSCGGAAEGCPAGTRCVGGACLTVLAEGQRCGDAHTTCPEGSRCSNVGPACLRPGVFGGVCRATGAPCDAGLRCEGADAALGRPGMCVRVEVASCRGVECAPGQGCDGARCVDAGAAGGPCRDDAAPCGPGLACFTGRCVRAAAEDEPCDAEAEAACEAGLVCRRGDDRARCEAAAYDVVVREGVAFESPCALPLTDLAPPFTARVLGVDAPVTLRPSGAMSWWPVVVQPLGEATPLRDDEGYAGCRRVVGAAPERRFVWGATRREPAEVAWEVVYHERTRAVEIRYDAPTPRFVSPRVVAVPTAAFVSPARRVGRGTSITFVPR